MDIPGVASQVDMLGVAGRVGIFGVACLVDIPGVVEQVEGVLRAVLVFLLVTEVLKVLRRPRSELARRLVASPKLLKYDF